MKLKDKRIKLTNSQKEDIVLLYQTVSNMAEIARRYNVSRSKIRDIVKPEVMERNKLNLEKRGGYHTAYPNHNKYNPNRYRKMKSELKEIKSENIFSLLRSMQVGTVINILKLKSGSEIKNFTITENNRDHKQLIQEGVNINYEEVKQLIFKTRQ